MCYPIHQELINNPPMDGIEGKAGKISCVIQVDEGHIYYKTSKHLLYHNSDLHTLHGFTKD